MPVATSYEKKSWTIDVTRRSRPKREKAKARYESARERLYPPLATKIPFTSRLNHARAGRVAPPISAWTKKKRNIKGTSHVHFEGLDDPSISPSPAVVVLASSRTVPSSSVERLRNVDKMAFLSSALQLVSTGLSVRDAWTFNSCC
jgi:hypothetical protein